MDFYSKQMSVLYVEDEKEAREAFEKTLKRYTQKQYIATDGNEGLELYKKHFPDIVITDIKMPNKNGIELAEEILEINPEQIIIFTTAHTESKYTLKALEMQVEAYLIKPINKNKFKIKLNHIAKNIVNNRENLKKQKIIQAMFDSKSNISVLTNFKDIEFASKSFLQLFNIKNIDEFFTKYKRFIDIFQDSKEDLYEETQNRCISAKNPESFVKEYRNSKDALVCLFENDKIYKIDMQKIDVDYEVLHAISFVDITTLHKERLAALHDAFHDKLTSAYNRSMFDKFLDKEYRRYLRYGRPLCLAIFDIDLFKNVNDSYGHLIGDEVLKILAGYFMEHIRETDIFARWGGEEFTLLMSETDIDKARIVCEKLREGIENLKVYSLPKFTVSAGLAQIDKEDTKEEFFKKADDALYRAKNSGRNKIAVYEKYKDRL